MAQAKLCERAPVRGRRGFEVAERPLRLRHHIRRKVRIGLEFDGALVARDRVLAVVLSDRERSVHNVIKSQLAHLR
jgi:hypothetical protein